MEVWNKYEIDKILYQKNYIALYRVIEKSTLKPKILKEINKKKYSCFYGKDFDLDEKYNDMIFTDEPWIPEEQININDFFYLLLDYNYISLINYLKLIENPLSEDEVKEVLIKINRNLKSINQNNSNYKLDKSKIYVLLDTIENLTVKLLGEKTTNQITTTNEESSILEMNSLGNIIYYMLFKNEEEISQPKDNIINIKNRINSIRDNNLREILKKLLFQGLTWEEYLSNPFFKKKKKKEEYEYEKFKTKCNIHNRKVYYYCVDCNKNICDDCFSDHKDDRIISFSDIGLNDNEKRKMEKLIQEIEENIKILQKKKDEIEKIFKEIEKIEQKEKINIYQSNEKLNYKNYYFHKLEKIREKTKIKKFYELTDYTLTKNIDENRILANFNITNDLIKKPIKISFMENLEDQKEIFIENYKYIYSEQNMKYSFPTAKNYLIQYNYDKTDFTDCRNLFSHCEIDKINVINLNCEPIINMSGMFSFCIQLKSIDLSNAFTDNLKDTSSMFFKCENLTEINLSNLNFSKLENMNEMFSECHSLKYVNFSNLISNNLKDMSDLFNNCYELEKVDLTNFNTYNVNYMNNMFYQCYKIKKLDLSSFNTSNVEKMHNMFYKCHSLTNLDISNFTVNKVKNMNNVFLECKSLIHLDLSNFVASKDNVEINNMFKDCSSLKYLNLCNFESRSIKKMKQMFKGCSSLIYLNIRKFDFSFARNENLLKDIFKNLNRNCLIIYDKMDIENFRKKIGV